MNNAAHSKLLPAGWIKSWSAPPTILTESPRQGLGSPERQELLRRWKARWAVRKPPWGELGTAEPDSRVLKLHQGLSKARSSIAVQLRSGKTGLAAFLHRRRVPGYPSPLCPCGQASKTPKHVMIHCPKYSRMREELKINECVDTRQLLITLKSIAQVTA